MCCSRYNKSLTSYNYHGATTITSHKITNPKPITSPTQLSFTITSAPPPPIRSNTTLKAFQAALESYLSHLQNLRNQNEPAIVANVLAPFLQSLGLNARAAHKQKGKSEIDLALLKNNNVEVIIEAKKPSNKEEMFSPTNVNCRALHEHFANIHHHH